MALYLETTCIILAWSCLLSLGAAYGAYAWISRGKGRLAFLRVLLQQQPALLLGAVCIFLAYHLFEWVLFFPVHILSDRGELWLKAIVPAVVLLIASGFLGNLLEAIGQEYERWARQPFLLTVEAMGLTSRGWLRRLVILRVLILSWGQSLPWFFGELIIVESIFNAPGLGLDMWFQARQRDLPALASSFAILAVLYGLCALTQYRVSQWLGEKLEGYC